MCSRSIRHLQEGSQTDGKGIEGYLDVKVQFVIFENFIFSFITILFGCRLKEGLYPSLLCVNIHFLIEPENTKERTFGLI